MSTLSSPEVLAPLWRLRQAPAGSFEALKASGRFTDLACRLLAVRGYKAPDEAAVFLAASLGAAHHPRLLSGMDAAVERLKTAWSRREKVAIFGDYDVDGVTSTVLLAKLFSLLGLAFETYIPDRMKEGYGPNLPALLALQTRGASVVITVDCGTSAVKEAAGAAAAGLDLIITDHHIAPAELPQALALVNPQTSPDYPYAMLGGVGVAYKLAQALLEALDHPRRAEFLDHMLELVALGTLCDVAPLDGENRALVKAGLARLKQGRWLGLRSLADAADLKLAQADAGSVGFVLGPRLNAGGRIGDASLGVQLLLSKDPVESRALAQKLNAENKERQAIEKKVVEHATQKAEQALAQGAKALVLWDEAWHPGVVGLAASRLLERFQRPAFVFGVQDGLAKGSGRSRKPFHLVQALEACAQHLVKFGGHAVAAGATARLDQLPAFAEAFLRQAQDLNDDDRRPVLELDLEVRFDELNAGTMEQLAAFEPHGPRNAKPLFLAKGLRPLAGCRPVGADGAHLKLELEQSGQRFSGIAFRQGKAMDWLMGAGKVDAAFNLAWNEWQGTRSLQLEVKGLRPS